MRLGLVQEYQKQSNVDFSKQCDNEHEQTQNNFKQDELVLLEQLQRYLYDENLQRSRNYENFNFQAEESSFPDVLCQSGMESCTQEDEVDDVAVDEYRPIQGIKLLNGL